MAITTNAICNSFKKGLLEGTYDFKTPGGNTFKLALFTSTATLGKSTTVFAGGAPNGESSSVLDFGSDKTASSGTFTIQFPAFTTSAAILRIA